METSYDIGLVLRAVEFASQKHRMNRRKDIDASPYAGFGIVVQGNHDNKLMRLLLDRNVQMKHGLEQTAVGFRRESDAFRAQLGVVAAWTPIQLACRDMASVSIVVDLYTH